MYLAEDTLVTYEGRSCKYGHTTRYKRDSACASCAIWRTKKYCQGYINGLLINAKSRAKKKNKPFNLTKEWAVEKYTGQCELSGIKFKNTTSVFDSNSFSASIDRIDPKIGYLQENCRFILNCLNSFKGTMSDEQMFEVLKRLYLNINH